MHYGVNSGQPGAGLWTEIHTAVGGFGGYRCYSPPQPDGGIPTVWPTRLPGVTFVIFSIKPDIPLLLSGALAAGLRQLLLGAAPGDWLTAWHEGETRDESELDGHVWTPDEIKACHAYMHTFVRTTRPDVKYGQISSGYTATPYSAYRPLTQWIQRGLDFQGIDQYRSTSKVTVANSFEQARLQILAAAPHAKIAVNEVNSIQPGRAQYLRDVFEWAQQHKCLAYFPFFDAPETTKYDWEPVDPTVVAEMQRQVAAL